MLQTLNDINSNILQLYKITELLSLNIVVNNTNKCSLEKRCYFRVHSSLPSVVNHIPYVNKWIRHINISDLIIIQIR
jgi:hypothetical protein